VSFTHLMQSSCTIACALPVCVELFASPSSHRPASLGVAAVHLLRRCCSFPRRSGVTAVAWSVGPIPIAADAEVRFASRSDAIKSAYGGAAAADFDAAPAGSTHLLLPSSASSSSSPPSSPRVLLVKLPEASGSSGAAAVLTSLRGGASAAVSRLRGMAAVNHVAFDMSSLAGLAGASTARVEEVAAHTALLTNYSFDRYATEDGTRQRMRTIAAMVRGGVCSAVRVCGSDAECVNVAVTVVHRMQLAAAAVAAG
jgi:hypothetical protein